MLPTLYTTKEVAKYLKVSDGYVRELLRHKILKGYFVFNKWLVTEEDLLLYLEKVLKGE